MQNTATITICVWKLILLRMETLLSGHGSLDILKIIYGYGFVMTVATGSDTIYSGSDTIRFCRVIQDLMYGATTFQIAF